MFRFAEKPQSLPNVLKDAFWLYRESFAKVWYIALVIGVIGAVQQLLPGFTGGGGDVAGAATQDTRNFSMFALHVVVFLVLMLPYAFFAAVIMQRIYKQGMEGAAGRMADSFAFVGAKIWTVYPALVLVLLIALCGTALFVVPGVFLSVLFMFYLPAILFENLNVGAALKRSAQLVWGNWWRSFAVLLPAAFLLSVSSLLLTSLMGKDNNIGQALSQILISTIILPLFDASILAQYNDLKLRRSQL